MSNVFQHVMCSLERDVVLKDLWKNLRTWHNRVTVVPWYNLYIAINNIFLSEEGNYNFHISYSIFALLDLGAWLPSGLVPQITSTLTPFILSIFSLSSHVSSSRSFLMSAKYQGMRSSGIRQFGRWRLKLLPQMSHKDSALMLSLPLCIWECLSMSHLIKMKWWSHYWCLLLPQLVYYHISDHSYLIIPKMIVIVYFIRLTQLDQTGSLSIMSCSWESRSSSFIMLMPSLCSYETSNIFLKSVQYCAGFIHQPHSK